MKEISLYFKEFLVNFAQEMFPIINIISLADNSNGSISSFEKNYTDKCVKKFRYLKKVLTSKVVNDNIDDK